MAKKKKKRESAEESCHGGAQGQPEETEVVRPAEPEASGLTEPAEPEAKNGEEQAPAKVDPPDPGPEPVSSSTKGESDGPAVSGPPCPVCDMASEAAETEGLGPRPFARCTGCGIRFRMDAPPLTRLAETRDARFKGAFALPHHKAKQEAKEQALEVMRGYFRIKAEKAAPLNAFGKDLLEVGCGLGFRLRVYANYGWMVFGTETGATAFEYSKRQMLDVKHGWFPEVGFGNTKFDLAVFPGNFGELPDPGTVVEKLADLLKPKALVCVLSQRVVDEAEEPAAGEEELFLYTSEALRTLFGRDRFAFVNETGEPGMRTFWFELRQRNRT